MDLDHTIATLAPALTLHALRTRGTAPFVLAVPDGLRLQLRYVEDLAALCICAPLGPLMLSTRTETRLRLLAANLLLSEAGEPHYAIDANTDTVYLCHTAAVPSEQNALRTLSALRAFLASWQESRDGLHAAALIA